MAALNAKQLLFAEEYVTNGLNGAKAAIAAGYSERSAKQQASRMLTNADLRAEVDRLLEERRQSSTLLRARIEQELIAIGLGDLRDVATWEGDSIVLKPSGDLDDDAARALQAIDAVVETRTFETGESTTVRIKIRQHDKLRALQLLAKMNGLVSERVEHSGMVGLTLSQIAEALQDE